MTRESRSSRRAQALVTQLPVTGEILLRGSLFERTVRHTSGCTICAGGGGATPLWVSDHQLCRRPVLASSACARETG